MYHRSIFTAVAAAVAIIAIPAVSASAAVSYTTPNSLYSQNFDGLPTNLTNNSSIETVYTDGWQDDVDPAVSAENDVSIPGWYLRHPTNVGVGAAGEGGFNGMQRLRFGSGQNTGAFWAFGSNATDAEKALGSIGSSTTAPNGEQMLIGLRLTNSTGQTLTSFTVTYDGEEWRDGQGTTGETMTFGYLLDGSDATNWFSNSAVDVPQLAFTSPVIAGTTSSGTPVNGNVDGLVKDISFTVTGVNWAPGTDLWLRWGDVQAASLGDDGMAIDNVRFSAVVPEPASLSLMAIGSLAAIRRRRR